MYPKNAASPPRIAIGAVVQISDGAVQSSGVSVAVCPEGGSETASGGTVSYGGSSNIVYYVPTQAETNYTAVVFTAYKTGCIPVSQTVVTTSSATPGTVSLANTAQTVASLTCTGSFTISDGLLVSRSTSNTSAITATGNGTGHGISAASGSGATGDGIQATAASTAGNGMAIAGTGGGSGLRATGGGTGNGMRLLGGGTSGSGLRAEAQTSGSGIVAIGAGTTQAGISAQGGLTTSAGLQLVGGGTSGDGLLITAVSGHGISTTGAGTTKHGIHSVGGSTTSHGINALGGGVGHGILATSGGGSTGDGIKAVAASTNGNGLNLAGVGTGAGLLTTAGLTGIGLSAVGGGTSGDGIKVVTTSGHGINLAPVGSGKHGIFATGGNGGTSDGISAVAGTGGVPIRGNITGDITGNLSGSVGSVTGLTAATVHADLDDIQARLPAALVSGRMDSSVGAIASGVDFSATMKASINTEVDTGISDAALATAANLATVAGYLDTEIAAILADTNELQTDWTNGGRLDLILDTAASGGSLTVQDIVDGVWDEDITDHLDSGSTGAALNGAGAAGDPWSTPLPGAYGSGTAGKIVGDNINATISSRATQTSVDDLPTNAELATALGTADDAVLTAINDLPTNAELATALGTADDAVLAAIAGLTIPTATQNADALLNRDMSSVSDTNDRTLLNAIRFLRNRWGVSGTTLTVYGEDDSTPKWTGTVTAAPGADPISGNDPT
jgi:hypothetical protein